MKAHVGFVRGLGIMVWRLDFNYEEKPLEVSDMNRECLVGLRERWRTARKLLQWSR